MPKYNELQSQIPDLAKKLGAHWLVDIEPTRHFTHYVMQAKWITIHNAASSGTGANLHNYNKYSIRTSGDGVKSWHLSVGEDGIFQALPLGVNGWHAGDGNGPGNRESFGLEIARDLASETLYKQAEDNGAKAAAILVHLLDLYWGESLGLARLRKHQDWSGKYCPHRILREGRWEEFKQQVQGHMEVLNKPSKPETEPESNEVTLYRVQVGAFSNFQNAKKFQAQVEEALQAAGIEVKPFIVKKIQKRY